MSKKYKTVSVSADAHDRLKKLSKQIFETPLSISKTIIWLLEKNDNPNQERRK